MNINIPQPKELLIRSIEESCALDKYAKTLKIPENVATNIAYQKNFNSYYKVRRDEEWLKAYYSFMQDNRDNLGLEFKKVLEYMSNTPHRARKTDNNGTGFECTAEVSFSSKLLATINPNFPIWDRQVIKAVGIEIEAPTNLKDRIDYYVSKYAELCIKVTEFINSQQGKECIALFDKTFPHYKGINSTKKIDFYLWNIGK